VSATDGQSGGPSIAFKMHLGNGRTSHRKARKGPAPKPEPRPAGRIPRVARLLALAHHFDDMIREGIVHDQAEIARLMKVTRARVTQIMNLLHLAPDIQEDVLLFPRPAHGKAGVTERRLRAIAAILEWRGQRVLWRKVRAVEHEPAASADRDGQWHPIEIDTCI
jgi:hypothetical protein